MNNEIPKNKIIIISELFYPDTSATAVVMTKMAKIKQNFNVEIICGPIPKVIDSIYYSKEKITLDHFTIFRGPSPSWSKNNLFRRIVKQLLMSISLMVILFKRLDKNTIVSLLQTLRHYQFV